MNFHAFSCALILTILFKISPSLSRVDNQYTDCSFKFNCGKITDLGFPFWGENRPEICGFPEFKLQCEDNVSKIEIMKVNYQILEVNQGTRVFRIARDDYSNGFCPETELINTTLDPNLFEILPGYGNLTLLYGCDSSLFHADLKFKCPVYGNGIAKIGDGFGLWSCKESVVIPVRGDGDGLGFDVLRMEEAIKEGFEVKWKVDDGDCEECVRSSGVCGFDSKLNRSTCFCAIKEASSSSRRKACWPDSAGEASPAMPGKYHETA